jgi:hypothetical protein
MNKDNNNLCVCSLSSSMCSTMFGFLVNG